MAAPTSARVLTRARVLAWARAAGEFGAVIFIAPTPETAPVAAYNRFNSVGVVETVPLVAALLLFAVITLYLGLTRIVIEGGLVFVRGPLLPQGFAMHVV